MANGAVFNSGVIATLYRNEATGETYTQLDFATKSIADSDVQRRWRVTSTGDLIGLDELGTDAISGFFHLPSMAGSPIGVPTVYAGQIPIAIDTVGKVIYGYIDSAWESLSAGGGGGSPLTVREVDAAPSVANVTTIVVPNGSLTDDGSGQVTITFAGGGAVDSVFGRTGVVVAQTNDYTWGQIDKTASSLADLATRSASDLTSGTLPDARFPSTLPAVNGSLLTNLNASNLASGTVPAGRIQEVIALADLTDVAAKTGTGTTVVMSSGPTITSPIIAALANLTTDGVVTTTGGNGTLSVQPNAFNFIWYRDCV